MGKLLGGPWGRVKGKVGNLVAADYNGETILKIAPKPSEGPPSLLQELHRNKFALAQRAMQPMAAVLKLTFRNGTKGSALAPAAGYALENAVTDTDGVAAIDYSKVLVSRGTLPGPALAAVTNSGTSFTFTWDDDSGYGSASAYDKVVLVVHCPDKHECFHNIGISVRADGKAVVDVKRFAGKEVHTYIAFIAPNLKKSSDSLYLGSFTPAESV